MRISACSDMAVITITADGGNARSTHSTV
jgi:hypothetical protein